MFNRKKIKSLQAMIGDLKFSLANLGMQAADLKLANLLLENEIEKYKFICLRSAKTAEQVCPENIQEAHACHDTGENV